MALAWFPDYNVILKHSNIIRLHRRPLLDLWLLTRLRSHFHLRSTPVGALHTRVMSHFRLHCRLLWDLWLRSRVVWYLRLRSSIITYFRMCSAVITLHIDIIIWFLSVLVDKDGPVLSRIPKKFNISTNSIINRLGVCNTGEGRVGLGWDIFGSGRFSRAACTQPTTRNLKTLCIYEIQRNRSLF